MKTVLTVLTTALALSVTVLLMLLAWQYHQNRQMRFAYVQVREELQHSREMASALTAEKNDTADKLTALAAREIELRKRVDSLETAAQSLPRPYRVRTFVGQANVGEAWMVPHNVTRDPDSGRYTFEPLLVIDESAKHHFTQHHTNVVEREVYRTEIYQNDVPYPYYYYATPGRPSRPGHPPGRPEPPTAPEPYQPSTTPQPDARARLFAPPMSTVESRPQVIGTPATSPINQRVFAP